MAKAFTWDRMIEDFRALGGVADNIKVKDGALGRGLFPVDPAKPVTLFAPKNLLYSVTELEFADGALRVKKNPSGVGEKEKEFFNAYQAAFSWGAGGEKDSAAFVESMDALPADLRDRLTKQFALMTVFRGSPTERTQRRFLRSRMIHSQGKQVVMPVVELVNHGTDGAGFEFKDGISVKGTFKDEILVRYNLTDPLGVVAVWGFASEEPVAFSVPMRLPAGNKRRLVILRNFNQIEKLGNTRAPTVKVTGEAIELSHLMLGHKKFPRLSKGVFYRLMKSQGIEHDAAEELFDRITHYNRTLFLQLLQDLEGVKGPGAETLRKACYYQMRAMSHSLGSREI
jgi:hypothetical protein